MKFQNEKSFVEGSKLEFTLRVNLIQFRRISFEISSSSLFDLAAGNKFRKFQNQSNCKWLYYWTFPSAEKCPVSPGTMRLTVSDLKVRPDSEPSDNKSECALTAESSSPKPIKQTAAGKKQNKKKKSEMEQELMMLLAGIKAGLID